MRIDVAKRYNNLLNNNTNVITPKKAPYIDKQIYHIYAIRVENRDSFQKYLTEHNIPTIIHYPIPIQKTKPFRYLDHFDNKNTLHFADELLSLPIYPFLNDVEIEYITETINNYF